MREVMGSDETMENNNDNNTGGIEAIDTNETVQENNPPDNVSTTNESESSVRTVVFHSVEIAEIYCHTFLTKSSWKYRFY